MNAFTCTGPDAMLILSGMKRMENRSAMPEPQEGRCAIPASFFSAAFRGVFI